MTTELHNFLLARIAEDEDDQEDPAVWGNTQWHSADCGVNYMDPVDCDCGIPSRVIADSQAKRTVLELHAKSNPESLYCQTCTGQGDDAVPYPCPTLRALAVPYAAHPDHP